MESLKKNRAILAIVGIALIMFLAIVIIVSGINDKNRENESKRESQVTEQESDSRGDSKEETKESENVTESRTETQIETESQTETESQSEQETESEKNSESVKDTEMNETVGGYKVYDPWNTRGLDTTKYGYSFGVASNEQPHSQSVNNQAFFDGLSNVDALTLDTKTEGKVLYLTFDCGYEYDNNTAKILDTLKEKEVKAAFFCTLDFLKDCPDTSARIINEGHILGNHSTTHPVFPDITRTEMASELYGVDKYLKDTYGYSCQYFRFPTGAYSENSLELCTSVGYRNVFWSVAYGDWDTSNQKGHDYAYDTVTARLHPGAVILLHAVSTDNVSALGDIIDYARANGYTFASLDDYEW